jgi:hypothetical protein
LKKWLRAQPVQPTTVAELQALLNSFVDGYNQHRPHRSLPHSATPATTYHARPKATPSSDRTGDTHDRVRTDRIDHTGVVTLRVNGPLHHTIIKAASAEPTPEPTSCYSSTTSTSESSTPPPANYCANSSSIPPATTNPPDDHQDQPRNQRTGEPTIRGFTGPGCPETSHL